MSNQEPKKPRRPKSKRLKLCTKEEWTKILKEVKKDEVPVTFLKSLTVNLKDGTAVDVNITELREQGIPADVIEKQLNSKLAELDAYIEDVDFYINVESVSQTVQPFTDKLLKNL
jgi:hypothetical protein